MVDSLTFINLIALAGFVPLEIGFNMEMHFKLILLEALSLSISALNIVYTFQTLMFQLSPAKARRRSKF
jgi:hypothetical protein